MVLEVILNLLNNEVPGWNRETSEASDRSRIARGPFFQRLLDRGPAFLHRSRFDLFCASRNPVLLPSYCGGFLVDRKGSQFAHGTIFNGDKCASAGEPQDPDKAQEKTRLTPKFPPPPL